MVCIWKTTDKARKQQTKLESLLSFNKTYLISNEFKKDIKQTAEDWT